MPFFILVRSSRLETRPIRARITKPVQRLLGLAIQRVVADRQHIPAVRLVDQSGCLAGSAEAIQVRGLVLVFRLADAIDQVVDIVELLGAGQVAAGAARSPRMRRALPSSPIETRS